MKKKPKPRRKNPDVYYNNTGSPIFITLHFEPDLRGGPGIPTEQYCVAPGHGIDLKVIGMGKKKICPKAGGILE